MIYKMKDEGELKVYSYRPFMPSEKMEIEKFKEHLDYLRQTKENLHDLCLTLTEDYAVMEAEVRAYTEISDYYKYPEDVIYDKREIIHCKDHLALSCDHLNLTIDDLENRIYVIGAIACYRAKEELDQPFSQTLNALHFLDPEERMIVMQQLIDMYQ